MKKILKFFSPEQEADSYDIQKTNAFIIIHIIGFFLISLLFVQTFIFKEANSTKTSIVSIVFLSFIILDLFVLKYTRIKTSGNILSIGLMMIMIVSMLLQPKDEIATIKYVHAFYTVFVIITISALYASRKVFMLNAISVIITTTIVFFRVQNKFPDQTDFLTSGYLFHSFSWIVVVLVLLYSMKFAEKSIKDAQDDARIKEIQNQELRASEEEIRASLEELKTTTDALEESYGELSIAKEKAEESDQLKSVFLTNMSHEIRTPLNGIIGFSNLLNNQEQTDETGKYYTEIISKSSEQLLKIIDDIIEISQLETKQSKINTSKVNLNYIILNLIEEFKYSSDKKGIDLLFETTVTDEDGIIYTDEPKLLTILTNLIENAIKFTKKGYVKLMYYIINEKVTFEIEDTGIGFDQGKTYNIFDRFVQANEGISIDFGGLGLGLTISKLNTELLGGEIKAESELGKGATFTFDIPYKIAVQKKEEKLKEKAKNVVQTKSCKILVAEDEEINFLFIRELLSRVNITYKILEATNGQEAVEIFTKNPDIDLILMDLKMPVMDGYKATKLIKDINPGVPVVVQTAYTLEEERKKSADAGCDDFISKPIKINEFKEVLNRNLNLQANSL